MHSPWPSHSQAKVDSSFQREPDSWWFQTELSSKLQLWHIVDWNETTSFKTSGVWVTKRLACIFGQRPFCRQLSMEGYRAACGGTKIFSWWKLQSDAAILPHHQNPHLVRGPYNKESLQSDCAHLVGRETGWERHKLPRVWMVLVIINTKNFGLPPSRLMAGVPFLVLLKLGVACDLLPPGQWKVTCIIFKQKHFISVAETIAYSFPCMVISDHDHWHVSKWSLGP